MHAYTSWNWEKIKQKLSNNLNHFLHPCCHSKIKTNIVKIYKQNVENEAENEKKITKIRHK